MGVVQPRTMRGALELLPPDQIAFQRMLDRIRAGFERFGFLPLETPVMEYVDVLLTKSGGETEKQVYFVQSTGARQQGKDPELALRFDLTVPLARFVAANEGQLQFPFRRYQIQRVYRGESAQRGRFREFYQCDVDVVAKDHLSLEFDAEIPVVIYDVFKSLGVGKFTIHLNHRQLLLGALEAFGVEDSEVQAMTLRELDKLDKVGAERVQASLASDRVGLSAELAARVVAFTGAGGTNSEVMDRLTREDLPSDRYRQAREELSQVLSSIAAYGVPDDHIRLNPAIARGLDYYTGIVYETTLDDHPGIGSICSGGRYDDLAGHYTRSKLPGVGISIGASRLFYQLRELDLLGETRTATQVLVARLDEQLDQDILKISSELRAAGINTEVALQGGKIGKQLKNADRAGIPLVVLFGSREKERGIVKLKDLRHSEEHEVSLQELVAAVEKLTAGAAK